MRLCCSNPGLQCLYQVNLDDVGFNPASVDQTMRIVRVSVWERYNWSELQGQGLGRRVLGVIGWGRVDFTPFSSVTPSAALSVDRWGSLEPRQRLRHGTCNRGEMAGKCVSGGAAIR
jgi:hypothetical protein